MTGMSGAANSLCVSATVFACLSKVCAPPPVGKGGSLRSTGGGHPVSEERLKSLLDRSNSMKSESESESDSVYTSGRSRDRILSKIEANNRVSDELVKDEGFRSWFEENKNRTLDYIGGLRYFVPIASEALLKIVSRRDPYVTNPKQASYVATLGEFAESLSYEGLTPEHAFAKLLVRSAIDSWASDSSRRGSSLSQIAASKVHRTSLASYKNWFEVDHRGAASYLRMSHNIGPVMEAIIRSEYKATQQWFAENGIKSVTLFRGVSVPKSESSGLASGDVVKLSMSPLSSWATRFEWGERFASSGTRTDGVVLAMEVPVKLIQSIAYTGRGCLEEYEAVVINKPSTATVVQVLQ